MCRRSLAVLLLCVTSGPGASVGGLALPLGPMELSPDSACGSLDLLPGGAAEGRPNALRHSVTAIDLRDDKPPHATCDGNDLLETIRPVKRANIFLNSLRTNLWAETED